MVKVWTHKPGGMEPFLVTEMSVNECAAQFDLEDAIFLAPLTKHSPSAAEPGPLGTNKDPGLVLFEVLADEANAQIKPGYYVSAMTADTVHELIGED
jgi:hypothetical protein